MKRIVFINCLIASLLMGVQLVLRADPLTPTMAISAGTNKEFQKFNEEIKNLPPAEKEAKIKAFNEKHGLSEADMKKHQEAVQRMTPEQRRALLNSRLVDLQKKKAAGPLTPAEQEQLKNMERWASGQQQRLQAATNAAPATNKPASLRK